MNRMLRSGGRSGFERSRAGRCQKPRMSSESRFAALAACILLIAPVVRAEEPHAPSAPNVLRQIDEALTSVFEKVAPAVVIIEVTKKADAEEQGAFDFDFFFRNPPG